MEEELRKLKKEEDSDSRNLSQTREVIESCDEESPTDEEVEEENKKENKHLEARRKIVLRFPRQYVYVEVGIPMKKRMGLLSDSGLRQQRIGSL